MKFADIKNKVRKGVDYANRKAFDIYCKRPVLVRAAVALTPIAISLAYGLEHAVAAAQSVPDHVPAHLHGYFHDLGRSPGPDGILGTEDDIAEVHLSTDDGDKMITFWLMDNKDFENLHGKLGSDVNINADIYRVGYRTSWTGADEPLYVGRNIEKVSSEPALDNTMFNRAELAASGAIGAIVGAVSAGAAKLRKNRRMQGTAKINPETKGELLGFKPGETNGMTTIYDPIRAQDSEVKA